ncbi:type II secretion system minor pseudopilin GspH [Methylomonas sp. EbB]|uniref:Type II secretion system protein H n=1 Tax=Methylomonas fluvii TaxID=1854564 RepID=A0ABR9DDE3_9GAMM|nr:type II secretion system minor pseudopilin GspH [Methylomonas fluvii]MBD9361115.1 type II secretion system minor pseudopilin GspH [Methylomonas fluvii]CAD6874019.1 General secretion pathway protein H [Methylomonas fluvii]
MNARGFTLIELLIAMVLIGVMSSMAMLAMGNADHSQQQQLEIQRLEKLLALAEQEAMIRGETIGLELVGQGYRFLSPNQGKWQPETGDALFRQRDLPAGMRLALSMDEKPVYLPNRFGGQVHPEPQIVFTPDGASAVFQIALDLAKSDLRFWLSNTAEEGLAVSSVAIKP